MRKREFRGRCKSQTGAIKFDFAAEEGAKGTFSGVPKDAV